MSHVAFVPLTGLRVREAELLEMGMSLPGLRKRAEALAELPALGLLTLAGMTPEPWTSSYHESRRWDENFVESVVAERPTLVAISALTASIEEAYQLSAAFRRRAVSVVMGGLHVTACPEEASRYCDAVVVGEGEPVWNQLLADAAAGCLRRRYQSDLVFDLAHSPVPRYDLLGQRPRNRMTLQTERGCPLACEFCGASRMLGRFREKPVTRIAVELDALTRIAPQPWLELADDNTLAGSRNPDILFELLANAKARYFTEVDWRIGERPSVLRGLAASGCVQVLVGIESMVFRFPGMGAKSQELPRVLDAVRAIQETGVVVSGCLIVGADGESEESLDRLQCFLLESPFAELQLTIQTPFPGTPLRRRLAQQGRLLADRGWSAYSLFDVTFQPDCMTVDQLEKGFRNLIMTVFSTAASEKRDHLRREIWRGHPVLRGTTVVEAL